VQGGSVLGPLTLWSDMLTTRPAWTTYWLSLLVLVGTDRGPEVGSKVSACKRIIPSCQGNGCFSWREASEQRWWWQDSVGCCMAGHAEPRHCQGTERRCLVQVQTDIGNLYCCEI